VDYLELDTIKAKKIPDWEPKIIDEKFTGWHRWEDQVISMGW
jgi:hypothetical protein